MYLQFKMRSLCTELSTCSNIQMWFKNEPTTTGQCKSIYSICLNNESRTLSNVAYNLTMLLRCMLHFLQEHETTIDTWLFSNWTKRRPVYSWNWTRRHFLQLDETAIGSIPRNNRATNFQTLSAKWKHSIKCAANKAYDLLEVLSKWSS